MLKVNQLHNIFRVVFNIEEFLWFLVVAFLVVKFKLMKGQSSDFLFIGYAFYCDLWNKFSAKHALFKKVWKHLLTSNTEGKNQNNHLSNW